MLIFLIMGKSIHFIHKYPVKSTFEEPVRQRKWKFLVSYTLANGAFFSDIHCQDVIQRHWGRLIPKEELKYSSFQQEILSEAVAGESGTDNRPNPRFQFLEGNSSLRHWTTWSKSLRKHHGAPLLAFLLSCQRGESVSQELERFLGKQ